MDRTKLASLLCSEEEKFHAEHPRSYALYQRARQSLPGGVPMLWMIRWAGSFPVFVKEAKGAHFTDVDGHDYIDFCLGDTGAMTGHAPEATLNAIREQAAKGITLMLPFEEAISVGEELQRRFGLPFWQFTLTATDANRHALRMARMITNRPKILIFNYCYHGTVDETFAVLDEEGTPISRPNNIGPQVDPTYTTKVIEFNDVAALETVLAAGDVAAVLTEPVMTNIGIIHPQPGFHDELRRLTRKFGTLLIIDETHTICTGPGGYTAAHGLQPDFLTVGKPLAGGLPAAVYGFTDEILQAFNARLNVDDSDVGGIGGTLAGNALSIAAMKATLEQVLTPQFYEKAIALQEKFTAGVESVIAEFGLPWIVKRLGTRSEYWFRPTPPRNGGEAAAAIDHELDRYMHLFMLNRGILMTPFHNMALISPETTQADVEYHTRVFREAVQSLV
ncbi:MAG: aspartate aminotransferase family protein [Anaerolineae bacterium CG_4_9_14_3_um_filter_57_17]|nr:aspartate aminotransferase family protein [bacterium]NCT20011.1 aspartate aminotransferase family protein [bacterium]OIO87038.1 MAG: aspartate aminotransferase family protein [Anaerolineae bacterium CG2_30_57_67]PJB68142.1 MAG: aspartate aminotransferase family protein [Anaerolineae bacterium CG_4_9_14_3_um_filter_57_17]